MYRPAGPNPALVLPVALALGLVLVSQAHAQLPMRFGDVRITGNRKTRDYVIRREIRARRGDPYDESVVTRARRGIGGLPGIDDADIRVVYTPADSALRLDVRVTERRTFRAAPLVRRGYENIYSFGLWMADTNFRGRSETLEFAVLARGNTVVRGRWENPWLGRGPRFGFGLDAQYRNYRYVYDDLGGRFEGSRIRRGRAGVSLLYSFSPEFRLFLTLGYERVESGVGGVTVEPGSDRFPTVFAGTRYDGRDSRIYPWTGVYTRIEAGVYGPGDDAYSIAAGFLDTRLFVPASGRAVAAARLRVSVKDGDTIPVYLREHIGGGLTLRGHDFGAFNGTNSMLAGLEVRVPVNFSRGRSVERRRLSLSIHLFADVGAAWEQGQSPDPDRWHGGFGGGVHLLNPWIQGLRLDYGWRDGPSGYEGRAHVEIGAMF